MALKNEIFDVGNAAMQAQMTHAKIFTDVTNAAGTTNASSSPRLPITWVTPAAGGSMVATVDLSFTGGEPGGPAKRLGFYNAASNGTFWGDIPLAGDLSFNMSGELTVVDIVVPTTTS